MSDFTIKEFRDEDLPALAIHWKESIKGWPVGFMSGQNEWTADTVREWLMKWKYTAVWLGWEGDVIVSFLSYCNYYDEEGVTYVATFNCHPGYRNKGYGRHLLVTSVDRAVRDKVKRLDLHTWSGNEPAVPLYKKCGFFWRPRTMVHMYNFLPTVLNNPLVKNFLGDTHWYDAMQQPLEIKEDDEPIDGCFYHKYTFTKNEKKIEVLVDPSTSGITGIISDDLTIRCDIPGRTHVAGFSWPVKWTFRSNSDNPVPIKITCASPDGIIHSFDQDFELRDEKIFETEVQLNPDLRAEEIEWLGKALDCRIQVNGIEMVIKPGVRVVPPFKLESKSFPLRLQPDENAHVILNLYSRALEEMTFTPEISSDGPIQLIDSSIETCTVPAESSIGIPVSLKAGSETGEGVVRISGSLKLGEKETDIHPINAWVTVAPKGKPVEIKDDDPEVTILSNGIISLRAVRKGGRTEVRLADSDIKIFGFSQDELGEPLSDEFIARQYDISTEISDHSADLVYKISSREFPGIQIERRLTIGTGSDIELSVTVHNASDKPFSSMIGNQYRGFYVRGLVIPLIDAIYYGSKADWFEGAVPIPTETDSYPERWTAWKSRIALSGDNIWSGIIFEDGFRLGAFWSGVPSVDFRIENLQPGNSIIAAKLRFLINANSWRDVQREYLKGKPSQLPTHERFFSHADTPIFHDPENSSFIFKLIRDAKTTGSASIKLPDGHEESISSDEWNIDNPMEIPIPDQLISMPGIHVIDYRATTLGIERSGRLPLIVPIPDSSTRITKDRESNHEIYKIDNGCIEFRVAPQFCGSLYRISEKSQPDINLLDTAFPEPRIWSWFNPWFGGIHPYPWWSLRFDKSKFSSDPVKYIWADLEWEGVRVSITPPLKWASLGIELLYLTRPGIPVILNILRFTETSGVKRDFDFEWFVKSCPSGNPDDKFASLTDEPGRIVKVHTRDEGIGVFPNTWVATYDPETNKTFGVVLSRGMPELWDAAGDGVVIFNQAHIESIPGETVELAALYVIADDPSVIEPISEYVKYLDRITAHSHPESLD